MKKFKIKFQINCIKSEIEFALIVSKVINYKVDQFQKTFKIRNNCIKNDTKFAKFQ